MRKSILIPLDACTSPPSREVIERIELDGDRLHLHCRPLALPRPPQHASLGLSPAAPRSGTTTPLSISRSASLDLAREEALRQRSRPLDAVSEYLPTTNAVYRDALIDLSTPIGSAPPSPTSERPPSPPRPPPPLTQRTLVLTRMPSAKGGSSSLIPALDDLSLDPPVHKAKLSPPALPSSPVSRSRTLSRRAPPSSPVALATSTSIGWAAADDSELRMAADWLRLRREATVAAAGSSRRRPLPSAWTNADTP